MLFPGEKTKDALILIDDRIDPVGAMWRMNRVFTYSRQRVVRDRK